MEVCNYAGVRVNLYEAVQFEYLCAKNLFNDVQIFKPNFSNGWEPQLMAPSERSSCGPEPVIKNWVFKRLEIKCTTPSNDIVGWARQIVVPTQGLNMETCESSTIYGTYLNKSPFKYYISVLGERGV